MTELEEGEIADRLHDVMLTAIAEMAPAGGGCSLPIGAIADAMIMLLAELLIASRPGLPAEEIERLTELFRRRLREELAERADRSGGPIGHA